MKEKIYNFDFYGDVHKVVLRKGTYQNNNTLAIQMVEVYDDGNEEMFGVITKNIDDSNYLCKDNNCAFIDTNNMGNDIVKWLRENNVATCKGPVGFSGFCCYPLVEFNADVLNGMAEL